MSKTIKREKTEKKEAAPRRDDARAALREPDPFKK
jgi:hypothetical protein